MKIDNQFTVSIPIDEAWNALTDLERIAPSMPGAQLTGRDGEAYLGTVKVKVGPVISEFAGTASFVEKDAVAYHAVIDAKGRDSRGSGNASAVITAQLHSDGTDRTVVTVETDLKISGKLAQFGSGMIAEVSSKLLGQFADSLEKQLAATSDAPTENETVSASAAHGTASPIRTAGFRPSAEPRPVDLTHLAGGAIAKRLLPVAAVIVVAVIVYAIVRR
jgi:uncharacterized protein